MNPWSNPFKNPGGSVMFSKDWVAHPVNSKPAVNTTSRSGRYLFICEKVLNGEYFLNMNHLQGIILCTKEQAESKENTASLPDDFLQKADKCRIIQARIQHHKVRIDQILPVVLQGFKTVVT